MEGGKHFSFSIWLQDTFLYLNVNIGIFDMLEIKFKPKIIQ